MEEWKKDEIQTIMRYNWARGLNSSECLIEMQPNTGSDCPNHNLIIQRYKGFDDDLSKAVLTSNSSSVQIDPLKIDVEGQLAKRKQLIYFGLPIESASKTEVITTTKEEFDDSSKNIPINSTVSDCVIEEAVIIKKERHNDEIKEDVNNATTGVELENSVYSEVKDESSIDIVHEIVSSATACHDGSFGIACTNSEVDCNQGGVKIEVIVEDLVPNVHQGYQNKQCSRAITPLCIQKDTCKRFACEYCGKTYKNKNHANRHMYYECQVMKMKNKKWKKYLCEECKRFFTSKYSLERHQFFLHSGVSEKVSCGTCRQTFVNVRGLESHLKKKNCGGTSQYHFICKVCNRKYRDGSSLKRHQLNECGKEPRYKCAHCAYCTLQKVNLIRHLARLHGSVTTNYPCTKCDKSYKNECTLKRHLDLECGREKLELCNLCDYRTKRKSCLTSHVLNKHPNLILDIVQPMVVISDPTE